MRFLPCLFVVASLACATAPRGLTSARTHCDQSCALNPACAAAPVAGTGEVIVPAATRALQAVEALRGFIAVTRFLDAAEKKRVERILAECVKQANDKVDEELFGKGRTLPDSECGKEPTVQKKRAPTWRRHLGIVKHDAAFDCIKGRLEKEFPNNFSVEPRYRKDEITKEVFITDRRLGSLRPDIVIHFTRNATRIQCIYDLKFPCGYEVGNPWTEDVLRQMNSYAALGGQCQPAIITPQLGIEPLSVVR